MEIPCEQIKMSIIRQVCTSVKCKSRYTVCKVMKTAILFFLVCPSE